MVVSLCVGYDKTLDDGGANLHWFLHYPELITEIKKMLRNIEKKERESESIEIERKKSKSKTARQTKFGYD